jgi:hypothetical protein
MEVQEAEALLLDEIENEALGRQGELHGDQETRKPRGRRRSR